MNFDPGSFLVSLVISSVGFVLLSYGRKMSRFPHGVTGVLLMIYPYFVPNVVLMLAIGAAMLGALWFVVKLGW